MSLNTWEERRGGERRGDIPDEHRYKNSQQNINKSNSAPYQKLICHYPGM